MLKCAPSDIFSMLTWFFILFTICLSLLMSGFRVRDWILSCMIGMIFIWWQVSRLTTVPARCHDGADVEFLSPLVWYWWSIHRAVFFFLHLFIRCELPSSVYCFIYVRFLMLFRHVLLNVALKCYCFFHGFFRSTIRRLFLQYCWLALAFLLIFGGPFSSAVSDIYGFHVIFSHFPSVISVSSVTCSSCP